MEPLFPSLPEDLAALTDEQLSQFQSDSLAAVTKIAANDAEFLGERTGPEILEQMQAGVEGVERLKAEQATRAEAAANFISQVEELALKATELAAVTDEAPEEPETPAEPEEPETPADLEAVVEPETPEAVEELPIAASADTRPVRRPPPKPAGKHQPLQERGQGAALIASAGIEGVGEGAELDDLGLAEAMITKRYRQVTTPHGVKEDVVIASVRYDYPEERRLAIRDAGPGNENIIRKVAGEKALVALAASGGLCAPVTPIYDVPVIAVPDRPVRAALVAFQAARGGVNVPTPPTVGDITGQGVITAAQDKTGGSPATKACQTIICPGYTEYDVAAVYHCFKYGNLGARAWPELVSSWNENGLAAHARLADGTLLDRIAAGSTAVTGAAVNGAVSTLIGHVLEAAAGIRSHYRMRDGATLRALFPAWVKDMLVLDIVRSQFERFAYTRDGVEQLFRMFDIEATFFLDGETGSGQVFAAQTAAAVIPFPTTLLWYLFPEGTWLYLDSGTLDLGIVRDSTLNSTNDFEIFAENWETAAKVGPVSLKITSTLCPNGAVAAPGTALVC